MAVQHADDGYSKHGNFGSLLVHSVFLMYVPNVTAIFASRGAEFEGTGSV